MTVSVLLLTKIHVQNINALYALYWKKSSMSEMNNLLNHYTNDWIKINSILQRLVKRLFEMLFRLQISVRAVQFKRHVLEISQSDLIGTYSRKLIT